MARRWPPGLRHHAASGLKTARATSLDELLFARIVLINDHAIEKTMILQAGEGLADKIASK